MLNIQIMELVILLIAIVKIISISTICASAIFTLDVAKSEGMILEKYGQYTKGKFYLKPFGGCGYCTLFWVGLCSGFFHLGFIGILCPFISFVIYKKI